MSIGMADEDDGVTRIDVANEVNQFGELWTQTFHGAYALDLGTTAGDDVATDYNPGPSVLVQSAPLGGRLEQNQVAEMVALFPDAVGIWFREEGDLEPTPHTAEAEFEITNHGKDTLVDNGQFGPSEGYANNTGLDPATWTETHAYSEQSYGERLWFAFCTASDAFADEVAGPFAGGAHTMNVHSPMTPMLYRNWFGRGPLHDDGDEVRCAIGLRSDNAADATLAYMVRFRVIWDVFEYPERDLQETQGPDIP